MRSIHLGFDASTGRPVEIPIKAFDTHLHLIGGTGKGKTTGLITMLHQLLAAPLLNAAFFIIDRLGSFSFDLLRWFASPFCPPWVRERLVYIEPAHEQAVLGFNPLLFDSPAHGYFRVTRATDLILRGWASQDISMMPRLARWTGNAFLAASQLGLNIADCAHLLLSGSPLREPLLRCLPERLQYEWNEVIRAHGSQEAQQLESTRNRLKQYWDSPILANMFGATTNRFDVLRFLRERKIVLINLAPKNRLDEHLADTVGGLMLNELFCTARSLPMGVRHPTYVFLDEFQRFVGPDIEAAIPEVRQLGLKLILSHQSLSQLERGDIDLTSLIFQCQTRLVFGVQGLDADMLAHEVASLNYDPKKIKDEVYSRRQLVSDHRIVELASSSHSTQFARKFEETYGRSWSASETGLLGQKVSETSTRGNQQSNSQGRSEGEGHSEGRSQSLVPVYDQFLELASRTYYSFEEQKGEWARDIRNLRTGQCVLRLVDDPALKTVLVQRSVPGSLSLDWAHILKHLPREAERVAALIDANFRQDCFCSPAQIEREARQRLQRLLGESIEIPAPAHWQSAPQTPKELSHDEPQRTEADPFV